MAPPADEVVAATAPADAEEVTEAPTKRPYKVMKKGKAKAKGKGKKKAKGKAKAKKLMIADDPDAEGVEKKEKVPKASGLRKRLLAQLEAEGRTIEEALDFAKTNLHGGDAHLQEAEALEQAQQSQEDEARKEYEEQKMAVQAAMEDELAAAKGYRAIAEKRDEAQAAVTTKRNELLDAQKSYAMLEVMALNHARMKELEVRRKAAHDAAEQARTNLAEQRQREKEALEATKRLLEEARQRAKGGKAALAAATAAVKRTAVEAAGSSPAKKGSGTNGYHTQATIADGEDIE